MEDIRPKGAWYAVYLDGEGYKPKAVVDLDKLADALPHGSGIDGDWYITVRRNGDIVVKGELHKMNDNGCYCGWASFHFAIKKAHKRELHPLKDISKVQVIREVGDIYIDSFRGGGENYGDYLYETIEYALSESGLLTRYPNGYPIIDAA